MPKSSEKSKIVNFLIQNALDNIEFVEDTESDYDEAVDEILDEMHEDLLVVLLHRRGINQIVPKTADWRTNILCTIDEERFRVMLRLNRDQFKTLLSKIENDRNFTGPNSFLQFPVDLQLSVVLFRLGSSGEGASIGKIAALFGIGDGGTIDKITRRVFGALLRLLPQYLKWPNATERADIVRETFEELPYCIGYIDGTEVKLAEQPVDNPELYFSRKHIYSVKLQVIVDYRLRIRDAFVGSPGSYHDAKMFKNSNAFKYKQRFFSQMEWIAGDSAYPLSNNVITPYRSNSQLMNQQSRAQFNKHHSKYRVRVEHAIGILKEKFSSLKELRLRFKDKESQNFCCEWILVCCMLHNMLLEDSDIAADFSADTIITIEDNTGLSSDNSDAENKRQALYHLMFE